MTVMGSYVSRYKVDSSFLGTKSVFGVGIWVGVVVGILSILHLDGSWVHKSADLTLPSGTKSVFGVGTWVGVVVGNTVRFYTRLTVVGSYVTDDLVTS